MFFTVGHGQNKILLTVTTLVSRGWYTTLSAFSRKVTRRALVLLKWWRVDSGSNQDTVLRKEEQGGISLLLNLDSKRILDIPPLWRKSGYWDLGVEGLLRRSGWMWTDGFQGKKRTAILDIHRVSSPHSDIARFPAVGALGNTKTSAVTSKHEKACLAPPGTERGNALLGNLLGLSISSGTFPPGCNVLPTVVAAKSTSSNESDRIPGFFSVKHTCPTTAPFLTAYIPRTSWAIKRKVDP